MGCKAGCHDSQDEHWIARIGSVSLDTEAQDWQIDRASDSRDPIVPPRVSHFPEKLRPLARAMYAAQAIVMYAKALDNPDDPRVNVYKKNVVDEILHEAGMLADRDYADLMNAIEGVTA